jgi:hypothetical protein
MPDILVRGGRVCSGDITEHIRSTRMIPDVIGNIINYVINVKIKFSLSDGLPKMNSPFPCTAIHRSVFFLCNATSAKVYSFKRDILRGRVSISRAKPGDLFFVSGKLTKFLEEQKG